MKKYIGRDTGISEYVKLSFVGKEYFSLFFFNFSKNTLKIYLIYLTNIIQKQRLHFLLIQCKLVLSDYTNIEKTTGLKI